MSRRKGAVGEREVVRFVEERGLHAMRTAPLQANGRANAADVVIPAFPRLHIEVKRSESLSVDAMLRQADRDSGEAVPVVFWRRNRKEWQAGMPLDFFLTVLRNLTDPR